MNRGRQFFQELLQQRHSMRARMTAAFTLSITLLLLLADSALVGYAHMTAQRSANQLLEQSIEEIKNEIAAGIHNPNDPVEFVRVEGAEMQGRNLALFLVAANGERVIAGPTKMVEAWPQSLKGWRQERIAFGKHALILALPWQKTLRQIEQFAFALLGLSTLIIAAAALGTWVLVGRTLAPIGALSTQAQRAALNEPSTLLRAPSGDSEVVELVQTLNQLLEKLQADAKSKSRFYAAASHELRTPLQSLSGFLELGLSRPRSPEEYRDTLNEAQNQSHNLVVLVNELLALNQLEASTSNAQLDDVDLGDVIERALQKLQPSLQAQQLHVEINGVESAILHAPWSHVEMLVRNLLENAAKYSTLGGTIRVEADTNHLRIWNQCDGISGWDESKIFEPFYRPDASRNSQTGGNGLGLAICKAVCDANAWKISVVQKTNGEVNGVEAYVLFTAHSF